MRRAAIRLAAGLFALSLGMAAAQAAPAPRRVVSLNPCLDAILLKVADPGQIAALSHYSHDPSQTVFSAEARAYPITWGSAEEIVALKADLVLTNDIGAASLTGALSRLHIRQANFAVPETIAASLAQVRAVAAAVGHPDRGEALAAQIQAALDAAAPRPGEPRLSALIFEYHGTASGPHTLADALLRDAGFQNFAPRYGLTHTGHVPLDALIADPPQVLLAGRMASGEPAWADRVLSHPALKALGARVRRETFPEPLMFCGGPTIIPAAEALAQARENALRGISQ